MHWLRRTWLPQAIRISQPICWYVILPPSNPANVQTLQDLAKPGLKLVLEDPSVPAGNYARQILTNMSKDPTYGTDFSTKVLANVVSNETDVKQVVAKVDQGEADAGIVYVTDALATPDLKTIAIPANYNVIAQYPIAAVEKAPNSDLACGFCCLRPLRLMGRR